MSDAIYAVGKTLVNLLEKNLDEEVSLFSPKNSEANKEKVCLFLYRITELRHLEQRQKESHLGNSTKVRASPLFLELHFLVVPFKEKPEKNQKLLGKVIQIFHDNARLRNSNLEDSPREKDEELRITMDQLSVDELHKIWTMLNTPYKPSVSYTIAPVIIESTHKLKVKKVVEKVTKFKG